MRFTATLVWTISALPVTAQPADVTYSTSSGPIGIGQTIALTLPRFDPAQGVLRSVLVSGLASVSGAWSVENLSAAPNSFGGYASATYVVAYVSMTLPAGSMPVMNPAYLLDPAVTLPAFDGTADYGGASGTVLSFSNEHGNGGPGQYTIVSADGALSAYVGAGSVTFDVCLASSPAPSMPPGFQTSVALTTDTFVQVRYTFEAFPTRICRGTSLSGCPCGNASAIGNGCGNSADTNGGALTITGVPSLSNDSLVLTAGMMPDGGALFFEGTSFAYAQTIAGDGLSCVNGNLKRVAVKTGATSQYPESGDAPVSSATGIDSPGLRTYQVWYRDSASYCTSGTFNFTNGMAVQWLP